MSLSAKYQSIHHSNELMGSVQARKAAGAPPKKIERHLERPNRESRSAGAEAGRQHGFSVGQASTYLRKGKSEHSSKDVACEGKRKEEEQLGAGFQPGHALFTSTCRPQERGP